MISLLACASEPAPVPAVPCPAPGPYGVAEGDYAEDVALRTCEGETAALHDLCGAPALVVNWYGWCPSCEGNADLARELSADLQAVVVLVEDPLAEPASAEVCEQYVEARPSDAAVWLDPDASMGIYGSTDLVLVLTAEGAISFVHETSNEEAIRRAVGEVTDAVASSP